jgi:IS5 family transposase
MLPKKSGDIQNRIFQNRLENIINIEHPLIKLSKQINWPFIEEKFGAVYVPDKGRPALPTRLMVGLHYLKGMFSLSDESVVEGFLENPYWQYFCGFEFFVHELPLDSSSMTRWRKRAGTKGFENMLSETLAVAERTGELKQKDFNRVNVDTTVQEKNVTFPTDAKLLSKGIELIARNSRREGIALRQSYVRLAKKQLRDSSRYAHARKFKLAEKCVRTLRTYLGRILRDVTRKAPDISESFSKVIERAKRIYSQKKTDKDKLYSYFAPEVSCIAKGKAHKKYEFGCKTSIVNTSQGNWIVGGSACHGNPFDGHTLAGSLQQMERIARHYPREAYCDKGYRGSKSKEGVRCELFIPGTRGKRSGTNKRFLKRRNAIEAVIGHLKKDHGMERNWLKGVEGDQINILMASCGFNMKKLLRAFLSFIIRSQIDLNCQRLKNILLNQFHFPSSGFLFQ